jgi:hypothetical protein
MCHFWKEVQLMKRDLKAIHIGLAELYFNWPKFGIIESPVVCHFKLLVSCLQQYYAVGMVKRVARL